MAEKKGKRQGKKQEPEQSTLKEEVAAVIGLRLAEARKGAKLTQNQLAERVGVVSGYISLVEQGQRLPSAEVLVGWAQACAVGTGEIFSGLEEELHHRKRQR